jgi:hypothetical protein
MRQVDLSWLWWSFISSCKENYRLQGNHPKQTAGVIIYDSGQNKVHVVNSMLLRLIEGFALAPTSLLNIA